MSVWSCPMTRACGRRGRRITARTYGMRLAGSGQKRSTAGPWIAAGGRRWASSNPRSSHGSSIPSLDAGSRRLLAEPSGKRGTQTPSAAIAARRSIAGRTPNASWSASARACRPASGSTRGPARAASTSGRTHGGRRPSSWLLYVARLRTDAPRTSHTAVLWPQDQLDRLGRGRVVRDLDARQRKQPQDSQGDHLRALADHADRDPRPDHSREPCGRPLDPATRKRVRVLTMAEIDQLATHADERYRTAIWLLALTGLRTVRAVRARVMDVDWEQGSVTVNEVQMWVGGQLVVKGPKTESGVRTIPIPAWLLDAFERPSIIAPSEPASRARPIACSRRRPASRSSITPSGGSSSRVRRRLPGSARTTSATVTPRC